MEETNDRQRATEKSELSIASSEVLRVEMARARFTLVQLAARSGVSRSSLNRFTRGERFMTIAQMYAIAEAFGMEPEQYVRQISETLTKNRMARARPQ